MVWSKEVDFDDSFGSLIFNFGNIRFLLASLTSLAPVECLFEASQVVITAQYVAFTADSCDN
jgi:hypothetical protein